MRTIKKEIGIEELVSRIPSLFPYIDFDVYGDSPLYKDENVNSGELGILHKATDSAEGSYGHVMGSFKMPEGVNLYSDTIMYYPSSYININDEDVVIEKYQYDDLSLYGRNCYEPLIYKYYGGNNNMSHDDYIMKDDYDNIDQGACDKYDYRPYMYRNIKVSVEYINRNDYNAGIDGYYVGKIFISDDKGNGWYRTDDNSSDDSEHYYNGNGVGTFDNGEYYELISRQTYLNRSALSKIDFRPNVCSSSENSIDMSQWNEDDFQNGDKTIDGINYKLMFFMLKRSDNTYINKYKADNLTYELYGLGVRKQLVAPGKVYSYRSMMDLYYAYRNRKYQSDYQNVLLNTIKTVNRDNEIVWTNVNDDQRFVNKNNKMDIISYVDYYSLRTEKDSFIDFIDGAIGKCYINESVDQYNEQYKSEEHPTESLISTYELINQSDVNYDYIYNCGFMDIDKIFECSQYIKTYEDDSDGSSAYLYVNKYNNSIITANAYNTLVEHGSSSYIPNKFRLINDTESTRINKDNYSKLPFYGQHSYVPYEYTNATIITAEEYNALDDKSEYEPYTYINMKNEADIIMKNVYNTAYKKDISRGEYVPYEYVNSSYVIISKNDFINIYNSDTTQWKIYTYVNTTKSDDIIMVDEYEQLPEYGSLDYTAISYIRQDDPTDEINDDDYYNLPFEGKSDYNAIYYNPDNTDDIIDASKWKNLSNNEQYQPYMYKLRDFIKTIDEFQYEALPKYGFTYYVENEYYALIDIADEGEQPAYETVVITAAQYNDDNYWGEGGEAKGEKFQYSIYNYKPDPDNIDEDDDAENYVVSFEEYNNIPYFGQTDYIKADADTTDGDINLHRNIYIRKNSGEIISEKEYEKLPNGLKDDYETSQDAGKCLISLVPEVIYLSQINNLLYRMKNMKRNHELMGLKKLPLETDVNCEYSRYLRLGGEDMIKLLEWLSIRAEQKAEDLMACAILDNHIAIPLNLNTTIQDLGYYTPLMNYKVFGDTIEPGERFTYVDEYGVAETYKNENSEQKTLTPDNSGKPNEEVFLRLRSKMENAVKPDEKEITLSGYIDSQLTTLRMPITYTNYMDQPEIPRDGEDWLFYYRKGGIYDVSILTDDNDNIVYDIDTGEPLAFGNVLADIQADNNECTITFIYYLNAHLTINQENRYALDKDSVPMGKYHGIKHIDTYHYEQYGELYDLVANGGFENYITSTQRGIEKYPFIATANNYMNKIINNTEIAVPYIQSEFEFTFDILYNSKNDLYNNVYKEDLLNGIHFKPIISNNAYIIRGTNAAFERHLRLGEIKSLEDLENYHNGSFFNVQNNF